MTTLRDISQKLTPTVSAWPDELWQQYDEVLKRYSEEQQKALLDLTNEAIPGLVTGLISFKDKQEAPSEEGNGSGPDGVLPSWKRVAELMDGDMGAAYELLNIAYQRVSTPKRTKMFHRSMLVSAVSTLEVLIRQLVTSFYLQNPKALGDEATFTLSDLTRFSDLADARSEAAEDKADAILRGGIEAWLKWFKSTLKIDLKTHCNDFEVLVEVIQRRHIAVHNGGTVNRAYQKKMRELAGTANPPETGTSLPIDADYLSHALDEIESAGNLLAAGVWTKALSDAEDFMIFELYVRSYDLLLASCWQPAACMCAAAMKRLDHDDDLYLIHKVNGWFARKKLGQEIQAEVEQWPTGTLNTRFQAARAALLDQFDNLEELLVKCVRAGDLELEDVWEWPLLGDFRGTERWQDVSQQLANEEKDVD